MAVYKLSLRALLYTYMLVWFNPYNTILYGYINLIFPTEIISIVDIITESNLSIQATFSYYIIPFPDNQRWQFVLRQNN
jgi:hypothetical protein